MAASCGDGGWREGETERERQRGREGGIHAYAVVDEFQGGEYEKEQRLESVQYVSGM